MSPLHLLIETVCWGRGAACQSWTAWRKQTAPMLMGPSPTSMLVERSAPCPQTPPTKVRVAPRDFVIKLTSIFCQFEMVLNNSSLHLPHSKKKLHPDSIFVVNSFPSFCTSVGPGHQEDDQTSSRQRVLVHRQEERCQSCLEVRLLTCGLSASGCFPHTVCLPVCLKGHPEGTWSAGKNLHLPNVKEVG